MVRYTIECLIQTVICLIAVSIVVFVVVRLTGDPIDVLAPIEATEQQRESIKAELGLDKPLVVQYKVFLTHLVKGDFGRSLRTGRPAFNEVMNAFPATLELTAAAIFLALVTGIPLGVYAATRRGKLIDFLSKSWAALGQSMPVFLVGYYAGFGFFGYTWHSAKRGPRRSFEYCSPSAGSILVGRGWYRPYNILIYGGCSKQ